MFQSLETKLFEDLHLVHACIEDVVIFPRLHMEHIVYNSVVCKHVWRKGYLSYRCAPLPRRGWDFWSCCCFQRNQVHLQPNRENWKCSRGKERKELSSFWQFTHLRWDLYTGYNKGKYFTWDYCRWCGVPLNEWCHRIVLKSREVPG